MPKQVTITDEMRDVLSRCRTEGAQLFLPEQLDRATYQAVNKVLTALGGKWDRKASAHVFPTGISDQLAEALASGKAIDQKRTADQFFTPMPIARRMVDLLDLPRHDVNHVLEPSAGDGRLVQALLEVNTPRIVAVEQDARLAEQVDQMLGLTGSCDCHDFLQWEACVVFDAVIMNPPFSNGADMAHVLRALSFLRSGGTLVAVMSPHWTFAGGSKTAAFSAALADYSHDWELLPDHSFRSSGTDVSTGILTVRKGFN